MPSVVLNDDERPMLPRWSWNQVWLRLETVCAGLGVVGWVQGLYFVVAECYVCERWASLVQCSGQVSGGVLRFAGRIFSAVLSSSRGSSWSRWLVCLSGSLRGCVGG